MPPLTGSTFAGGDGNLLTNPTTFGTTDWQNVGGLNKGIDLASGTTDNAFGGEEDGRSRHLRRHGLDPAEQERPHSLLRGIRGRRPRAATTSCTSAGRRTNVLGSANFNFEINHAAQPDLTTTGPKGRSTGPRRATSARDLRLHQRRRQAHGRVAPLADERVGSGRPERRHEHMPRLQLVPVLGDQRTLDGSDSIAAVNNRAVTDPIAPNAPRSLAALTFGETAIDLTAAGVFPAGTCDSLGSAMVTGRSSASFTSEIKEDFISPIPVSIANCGTINIIKHTDPRGVDASFGYTSTIPNPASGSTTPACTTDTTPAGFTLNDDAGVDPTAPITQGTANTKQRQRARGHLHGHREHSATAGFVLESLSCSVSGTGGSTGSQDATVARQANISLKAGGGTSVTCTYTNQQQLGAVKVSKTSIKVDRPGRCEVPRHRTEQLLAVDHDRR